MQPLGLKILKQPYFCQFYLTHHKYLIMARQFKFSFKSPAFVSNGLSKMPLPSKKCGKLINYVFNIISQASHCCLSGHRSCIDTCRVPRSLFYVKLSQMDCTHPQLVNLIYLTILGPSLYSSNCLYILNKLH